MLPSFLPYFPHFLHGRYVSFPASMNGIPFACRRATPQVSSLTQVTSFRRPCSFASHVLSQVSSLTSQTTSFPNPGHSHRPLRLLRRPRPSAGEPRVLLESVDILRVSENGPVHLRRDVGDGPLRECLLGHIVRREPSAGEPRVLLESVDILRVSENGPVHLRRDVGDGPLRECLLGHIVRREPSAGEPRVLLESVDILRVSENGPVHLRSGIVQVLRFCHVFHINLRILQRKLIAEGYEGTVVSSLFYLASGGPL